MPTTPVNGLRYASLDDNPNGPLGLQNLAEDVDRRLVGSFASAATRDAAIPSPTDNMLVSVAGTPMVRRSGFWTPLIGPAPIIASGTAGAGRTDGVEDSWFSATIADPGYRYRIEANASVRLFVNSGSRTDIRIRAGNGAADLSLPVLTYASGMSNDTTGIDLSLPTRMTTAVLTGASRIVGYGQRVVGSGSWNVNPAPYIYYRIVPA